MTSDNDLRIQKLRQVLGEYLKAVEDGDAPGREQLLTRLAGLADQLNAFADQHDRARHPTAPSDGRSEPDTHNVPSEDKTIPPSDLTTENATLGPQVGGPHPQVGGPQRTGSTIHYFGDYELLEEIARGGMGVIYKARQVSLNRIVALKMILAGRLASEEDVNRFYAEAEAAANLEHPCILPIHEVGEHEGHHFFSMSYVEGTSLATEIINGPLPPVESAEVTKKVAEAIAYAHERGVIHRDLKPANVLLDQSGQPKVTDFGVAKRIEGDSKMTRSGQILGTPSYMPPEQAAGKITEVTEAADVYSLGAILYDLITGRPPFQADNHLDTLVQVLEQEPVSPRQLNRNVPRDLDTICLKCLQKDQSRRYRSAKDLAADLECWLSDVPIKARPVGPVERCWRWCRRNPIGAVLTATAALLLITLVSATFLVSWSWNRNRVAIAQRDEQRRQARVSGEESIFLTRVVQQGNAIDNRFSDYEGPLEDLLASVTKVLAQDPPDDELIYLADHIDSGDGPVPHDLAHSNAHGKLVSIEHGTVAGFGCADTPESTLRHLMILSHDFRRVFKRTLMLNQDGKAKPPSDPELRRILVDEGPNVAVPWMYYSRNSGIHYGYPGKGGYGPDYNPCERPFYGPFRTATPRGLVWGELYRDTHGLGLLLPCCAAIFDADDHVLGIVGFDVRVEPIREMLEIDLPYFVKSYLVDANWMIIIDSDMSGRETSRRTRPFPFGELVEEAKQGGSWLVKISSNPRRHLAVFPLHVKGWHYVVEADSERLTQQALME